jgi:hypothetical protein
MELQFLGRVPSQKGISVIPVVLALKQHPDGRKLVPRQLWKYFDEHLVVSGWYPERDYWVLIEALVKTMDPAAVGGDVWRYFARFSAKRDIGDGNGAGQERPAVYRNFAAGDATDPASFFRRATMLWSQYHNTGRMEIVGARPDTNSVLMRLVGFVIPIEGFVRLQGYYLEEYGRLVGMELTSSVTRSTARGDKFCEWEFELARNSATQAFVATLPPHGQRLGT